MVGDFLLSALGSDLVGIAAMHVENGGRFPVRIETAGSGRLCKGSHGGAGGSSYGVRDRSQRLPRILPRRPPPAPGHLPCPCLSTLSG
jgi:hypothetical protein